MASLRGFRTVALALLVGGLAGCAAEPRQPGSPALRFTLLEHVRVAGACVEERGGGSARYAGFVERWRDVKKGRDLLHGAVSTVDRFVDPGRAGHRPPLSIQFGEIDVAPLTAGQLVLTGVSEGSQPSRATCTLDVIAREQPARQEGRLLASLLGTSLPAGGAGGRRGGPRRRAARGGPGGGARGGAASPHRGEASPARPR